MSKTNKSGNYCITLVTTVYPLQSEFETHTSSLCLKGGSNKFTAAVTRSLCVWLYQIVITDSIQLRFGYMGGKLTLIFNLSRSASLKLY